MTRKIITNGFDKDPKRAAEAGRKGGIRRAEHTKAVKDMQALNREKVTAAISKYMAVEISELNSILKNPGKTPVLELMIIKIMSMAIAKGDQVRLNFLLERTIGKVKDEIDINAKVGVLTVHDVIIRKLEGVEPNDNVRLESSEPEPSAES